MGRYLEEVKKIKNAGEWHRQNRQNPLSDSFVSFVGSSPAHFEINIIKNCRQVSHGEETANHAELTRLVRLCGEHYGFTKAEHSEALAAALADPVDALTCFRTIAAQLDIVVLLKDVHKPSREYHEEQRDP